MQINVICIIFAYFIQGVKVVGTKFPCEAKFYGKLFNQNTKFGYARTLL